jgi:hypothetical protein
MVTEFNSEMQEIQQWSYYYNLNHKCSQLYQIYNDIIKATNSYHQGVQHLYKTNTWYMQESNYHALIQYNCVHLILISRWILMQGMENVNLKNNIKKKIVTSYGRMMTATYIVQSVSFWTSCNTTLMQLRKSLLC